jgi:hypothetical protein
MRVTVCSKPSFPTSAPTTGSGIITSLEVGYPILLPLGPRFI